VKSNSESGLRFGESGCGSRKAKKVRLSLWFEELDMLSGGMKTSLEA
jgi:hypothetical protein